MCLYNYQQNWNHIQVYRFVHLQQMMTFFNDLSCIDMLFYWLSEWARQIRPTLAPLMHWGHEAGLLGIGGFDSHPFLIALFLFASPALFDSKLLAPDLMRLRQVGLSSALDSQVSVSMSKSFTLALRESRNLFFGLPLDLFPSLS